MDVLEIQKPIHTQTKWKKKWKIISIENGVAIT